MRGSELREEVMERGGSGRSQELFFWRLGGRWREAVQIMVDERRDAQIDNRRDL